MQTRGRKRLQAIIDRISGLEYPSLEPVRVEILDGDTDELLVTVEIRATRPGFELDPDDFLALRRDARNIALEEVDPAMDVRLVYEGNWARDEQDSPTHPSEPFDPSGETA